MLARRLRIMASTASMDGLSDWRLHSTEDEIPFSAETLDLELQHRREPGTFASFVGGESLRR
jgi:hypothetical protein